VPSTDNTVDVSWAGASDFGSGADGYSFHWDTSPASVPDQLKDAEETAAGTTSPALAPGSTYYFHLRTRDNAGNWSGAVHLGPFPIAAPTVRPARCLVPNVKRKKLAAARSALTRARCRLGTVRRAYSNRVKRGRVVAQSRRPGARLPRGAKVNVVVSRGRRR
jgi:hypothetical protein